jgi:hypothetical protein
MVVTVCVIQCPEFLLRLRRGRLLIKIRYSDLPAGLHVRAEAHGRGATIYLLPGLTPTERRAALLRARRNANMGHGPRLPATGVAIAVAADRVSATLRNGAAAFRAHPLLLLPPLIIVVSATLVYILTAAVTITFRAPPQASGPYPQIGVAPGPHRSQPSAPGGTPGDGAPSAGPDPTASGPRPGRSARPPGRSHSPSPSGSASASPRPTPPPGSDSPTPAPTLTPTPSPTPSPSPTCLDIGPLGICLKL